MYIHIILSSVLLASTLGAANLQATKDDFTKATQKINQVQANTPPKIPANTTVKKKLTIAEATLLASNSLRSKPQICSKATKQLRWNKGLYQVAKEHSIDMAVNQKLAHDGSGLKEDTTAQRLSLKRGSHFYERVNQKENSKEILSGELVTRSNISLKSPKDLLNYWIARPADCKVIMDARFTDIALAQVISNKDNKTYWTLMLVGPRKK